MSAPIKTVLSSSSKMIWFVLLCSVTLGAEGGRILAMFPTPSVSHQIVFRPLMLELARRGHSVTVVTTNPLPHPPANYTQIDVHDISYNYWNTNVVPAIDPEIPNLDLIHGLFHAVSDIVELQLRSKQMQDFLKNGEKFDLIFVEGWVGSCMVMSHIFKAPVIQISSLAMTYPQAANMGAMSHWMLYPDIARTRSHNLTLWEKMEGVYEELRYRYLRSIVREKDNAMLKRVFGSETPEVEELLNNVDMLFISGTPLWDGNRAVPPSVIYIGGLHLKPPQELPQDLKTFMDNSKRGVIYMSFGTNFDTKSIPIEKLKIFCEVFSKLPYDVLWKWNGDELPGKPNNVRISKWFPQRDLLVHPNTKLFITQAGLQSTEEALAGGVPMLAIPIFGDQFYNAENIVHHGAGVQIDFKTFTADDLNAGIEEAIGNEWYRQQSRLLGSLTSEEPQSPLERAVWWTELVMRKGGRHLRSRAFNATVPELIALDVLLVCLGILSLMTICAFYVIKSVVSCVTKRTVKSKVH